LFHRLDVCWGGAKYEAFGLSLLTAEMNDVYEGKPGRFRGGTILAEAIHTKSKHLGRFAYGPGLVRCFSLVWGWTWTFLGTKQFLYSEVSCLRLKGAIFNLTGMSGMKIDYVNGPVMLKLQALLLKLGEI
jgi:hypothetical protein